MFGRRKTISSPSFNSSNSTSSSSFSSSSSPPLNTPSANDIASQPPRFSRLLQPAIDGPPSPENIRAYTEQMKRSSLFAPPIQSTASSSASSFYSTSSGNTSRDLSRTSSRRSNASSMPSKTERPESIQIFGKAIFARRTSRKSKRETGSGRTSLALPQNPPQSSESSAKDHYYGMRTGVRRATLSHSTSSTDESKSRISRPFNFQHVMHTAREQMPDLTQSDDLASNFSSLRDSQIPVLGQLKGIRAEDLHFENFSSERLDLTPELESEEFERPGMSPSKRNTLKKSPIISPRPRLTHAKSHDGLRAAPPRPPRGPLDTTCPLPPPPRTSSRTSSMKWDNYDPLATTTLERPETVSGFRKPKAFHLPTSPPRPITRSFEPEEINVDFPSTPRTPATESWPLSASATFENLALADVPEEEEILVGPRRSRLSTTSSLRHSHSVPAFARLEEDPFKEERPMTPVVNDSGAGEIGVALSPARQVQMNLSHETWEDDIDYCYEHEAEADCEYDWDRCSFDAPRPDVVESPKIKIQRRSITRSPVVPSNLDVPALSPSGVSLSSPQPYTPGSGTQTTRRMSHLRSPSHASSFKESHGFHLSPSLLIPGDFAAQMDVSLPPGRDLNLEEAEDTLYDKLFSRHDQSEQYHPFDDPRHGDPRNEDTESSPSSAPLSSRSSALSKSASLESVALLSRAANVALQMRSVSVGSSASLPELVHSRLSHSSAPYEGVDLGQRPTREPKMAVMEEKAGEVTADDAKKVKEGLEQEQEPEQEPEQEQDPESETVTPTLSLRARSSSTSMAPHSRKSSGGRKRAGSSAPSYMLFPQICANQTLSV